MLSISSNPQLKFRSSQTNKNTEYNDYMPMQENDSADTFELESAETESPIKQNNNRIPKFVRNIVLGTALVGGLGAAAPQASAQNIPVGKVITEQKQVDPKNPNKGKATYYYSVKPVMDSVVVSGPNVNRKLKINTKLVNTYPEMTYSKTDISTNGTSIYSNTILPFIALDGESYAPEQGYQLNQQYKDCSNKISVDIFPETKMEENESRENRIMSPIWHKNEENGLFNDPTLQGHTIKNGNRITKSGITNENTNNQAKITAYYTEIPVLDSVIVKRPNGFTTKEKFDRDIDDKGVNHINYSDSNGEKVDFWVEKDDNNYITYSNLDTNYSFTKEKSRWDIKRKK